MVGRAPIPEFGHVKPVRHCSKCYIAGGEPRPVPRAAIPCRTPSNPFNVSSLMSLTPNVVITSAEERKVAKEVFFVYQVPRNSILTTVLLY